MACAALVTLRGSTAYAASKATTVLDVRVDPAAEDCPSADDLRTQIAARLGYDPVDEAATQTVIGTLRLEKGRLVATVSLRSADGSVRTRKPLVSETTDCREIAASFVLAISIAIDPMSAVRAPPPPPTTTTTATTADRPVIASGDTLELSDARRPEPTRSGTRLEWRGGAGILGSLGALPRPSVAPTIVGGASSGRAALQVEGRYDLPASADGPNSSAVTGSLLLGTLAPCFEPPPAFFCALGSAGVLFGEGSGVLVPRSDRSVYAAIGLRAGLEARFGERIRGRIQIEGLVPLVATSLSVAGSPVWSSPAVVGSLGTVLLFR
jgi:hypothetical protein